MKRTKRGNQDENKGTGKLSGRTIQVKISERETRPVIRQSKWPQHTKWTV